MSQLAPIAPTQTFGTLLKHWRLARRMSQLALALEAEISARHLSFLETGRALPSRDMVLLLASMLDVPLRERNALLIAARYAPVYQERSLAAMTRAGADALIVLADPALLSANLGGRIADLAATHRLPAMYAWRRHVDAGGLMSYGPNLSSMHRRAAYYVDRILLIPPDFVVGKSSVALSR